MISIGGEKGQMGKQLNGKIQAQQITLIDKDGKKVGIIDIEAGLKIAEEENLDLVRMNDELVPVCRLMDYSKTRYNKRKKKQKVHKTPKIKEIRFTLQTGKNDIITKTKQIEKFISSQHKVKISIKTNRVSSIENLDKKAEEILQHIETPFKRAGNSGIGGGYYSFMICP